MALCRVCTAEIVWCETANGERIPLDEHEQQVQGDGRWRIVELLSPRPRIEPVGSEFPAEAMVDHRTICQQPRAL